MICEHEDVLPQASVAVHVRVIVDSAGQDPALADSDGETGIFTSQLSVAVTSAGSGIASHSTVVSAGQPARTGGVVSSIVTSAWHSADDPLSSVTVIVTVQSSGHGATESTVRVGVSLVASSKVPPGQSVVHWKVSGSPSGSKEPVPSSKTSVVAP
jgi:hypothetical protein